MQFHAETLLHIRQVLSMYLGLGLSRAFFSMSCASPWFEPLPPPYGALPPPYGFGAVLDLGFFLGASYMVCPYDWQRQQH